MLIIKYKIVEKAIRKYKLITLLTKMHVSNKVIYSYQWGSGYEHHQDWLKGQGYRDLKGVDPTTNLDKQI